MTYRAMIALILGLSQLSCDKPGAGGLAGVPEEESRFKSRPRPDATAPPVVPPEVPLRKRLAIATEIGSSAEREKAVANLAWDAIETEPETAKEVIQKLPPDSQDRINLIQHLAKRLAERNVDEALEWAKSLGSEKEISAAVGSIALSLAATDPVRAATLVSEFASEGRDYEVSLFLVAESWAGSSPQEAAEWVAHFPPIEARKAGIQAILKQWVPRDPEAAFAWVESQQDPEIRNEAIEGRDMAINQQPEKVRKQWQQHFLPE